VGVSATVDAITAPGTPIAPALRKRKSDPIERDGGPPREFIPRLRASPRTPRTSALSIRGSIRFIALKLPERISAIQLLSSEVKGENQRKIRPYGYLRAGGLLTAPFLNAVLILDTMRKVAIRCAISHRTTPFNYRN
jgi:hypothetical protein